MNHEQVSQPNEGGAQSDWDNVKEIPFAGAVEPSEISRISISETSSPVPKTEAFNATVTDASGNTMKTSNIVVGEKSGVKLESGDFLSVDEISNSINNFIAENGSDDAKISRIEPPKEYGSSAEMISDLVAEASQDSSTIELSSDSKITNQDARAVNLKTDGNTVRSSDLFLGNERVEMPNGEFVSQQELQDALTNYVLKVPGTVVAPVPDAPETVTETPIPEHETPVVQNEKKDHRLAATIGALLLSASLMLSLTGDGGATTSRYPEPPIQPIAVEQVVPMPEPVPEVIEKVATDVPVEEQVVAPEAPIENPIEAPIEDPADLAAEQHEKFLSGLNIGNKVDVQAGVVVHESSDYEYGGANATGTVNENARYLRPGEYTVESFSILNPETHGTDNVTWVEGTNIGQYLDQVAEKYNVSREDLEAKIHLGKDGSAAGWVDLSSLEQGGNHADN